MAEAVRQQSLSAYAACTALRLLREAASSSGRASTCTSSLVRATPPHGPGAEDAAHAHGL